MENSLLYISNARLNVVEKSNMCAKTRQMFPQEHGEPPLRGRSYVPAGTFMRLDPLGGCERKRGGLE